MRTRDRRMGTVGLLRWGLVGLCVFGLMTMIGLAGAYPPPSQIYGLGEGIGFCLLAGLAVFSWWFGPYGEPLVSGRRIGLVTGAFGGLIWAFQMTHAALFSGRAATGDLATLGLVRDRIEDLAWAAVAVVLLAGAGLAARRAGRWREGFVAGVWGGAISGLFACLTALCLVAFAMPAALTDPLNIETYAQLSTSMSRERVFAAESMASAILHLVVVGMAMGTVLGAIGGLAAMGRRDLARA